MALVMKGLAGGLGLLITLGACQSLSQPPSKLQHDLGQMIDQSVPYQWVDISDNEYRDILMYEHEKEFKLKKSGIAPPQHPARQRIQYHMDQIDALLRENFPDQLKNVPPPKAQLILTRDSNAVIYPISQCLSRRVQMQGSTSKRETRYLEFTRSTGRLDEDRAPDKPVLCLDRSFTAAETQAILDWNFAEVQGCSYRIEGAGLQLGSDCIELFNDRENVPESAKDFAFEAVPSAITFYAGLLIDGREDLLIFDIAHEMAHYYRAHVVVAGSHFGVYYELKEKNPTARPQPSARLASFAREMAELIAAMGSRGVAALSAPQKIRWRELQTQAYDQSIGQYTREQEADELGLELLVAYGVAPEVAVENLLETLRLDDLRAKRRPAPQDPWDYARCKDGFDRRWQSDEERPLFVPIGDYSEEHHSLCYRAFNLSRELEVHPYQASGGKPKLLPPAGWKRLQEDLQKEVLALKRN